MRKIQISPKLSVIQDAVSQAGGRLYAVCECVRSSILGLGFTEIFVTSNADLSEIKGALSAAGIKSRELSGEKTVQIEIDGEVFKYTQLCQGSLQSDALNRDFTIDALYFDVLSGEILDPTGRGLADLSAKRIRTCVQDAEEALRADGLRILRMSALHAELGFEIDEELMDAAKRRTDALKSVSKERIYKQLAQILLLDNVEEALFSMLQSGAMFELFPPFADAQSVGYGTHHKYSVMTHCIKTCAASKPELPLRLAGLLHDIGKPEAYRRDGHMKAHGVIGERMVQEILTELGFPLSIVLHVKELTGRHMFNIDNSMTDEQLRKGILEMGEEITREVSELRRADLIGAGKGEPPVSADSIDACLEKMLKEGLL